MINSEGEIGEYTIWKKDERTKEYKKEASLYDVIVRGFIGNLSI